jgi:hypothetical protein
MQTQTIAQVRWFKILLTSSFVMAFLCAVAPNQQRPLNFHIIFWWSIPLACLWTVTAGISGYWFGRKTLWMMFGAPLVLYWPVWLVLHGIPPCYWHATCK